MLTSPPLAPLKNRYPSCPGCLAARSVNSSASDPLTLRFLTSLFMLEWKALKLRVDTSDHRRATGRISFPLPGSPDYTGHNPELGRSRRGYPLLRPCSQSSRVCSLSTLCRRITSRYSTPNRAQPARRDPLNPDSEHQDWIGRLSFVRVVVIPV